MLWDDESFIFEPPSLHVCQDFNIFTSSPFSPCFTLFCEGLVTFFICIAFVPLFVSKTRRVRARVVRSIDNIRKTARNRSFVDWVLCAQEYITAQSFFNPPHLPTRHVLASSTPQSNCHADSFTARSDRSDSLIPPPPPPLQRSSVNNPQTLTLYRRDRANQSTSPIQPPPTLTFSFWIALILLTVSVLIPVIIEIVSVSTMLMNDHKKRQNDFFHIGLSLLFLHTLPKLVSLIFLNWLHVERGHTPLTLSFTSNWHAYTLFVVWFASQLLHVITSIQEYLVEPASPTSHHIYTFIIVPQVTSLTLFIISHILILIQWKNYWLWLRQLVLSLVDTGTNSTTFSTLMLHYHNRVSFQVPKDVNPTRSAPRDTLNKPSVADKLSLPYVYHRSNNLNPTMQSNSLSSGLSDSLQSPTIEPSPHPHLNSAHAIPTHELLSFIGFTVPLLYLSTDAIDSLIDSFSQNPDQPTPSLAVETRLSKYIQQIDVPFQYPITSWLDFKKSVVFDRRDGGYSYFNPDDVFLPPPLYSTTNQQVFPPVHYGYSLNDIYKATERRHWRMLCRVYAFSARTQHFSLKTPHTHNSSRPHRSIFQPPATSPLSIHSQFRSPLSTVIHQQHRLLPGKRAKLYQIKEHELKTVSGPEFYDDLGVDSDDDLETQIHIAPNFNEPGLSPEMVQLKQVEWIGSFQNGIFLPSPEPVRQSVLYNPSNNSSSSNHNNLSVSSPTSITAQAIVQTSQPQHSMHSSGTNGTGAGIGIITPNPPFKHSRSVDQIKYGLAPKLHDSPSETLKLLQWPWESFANFFDTMLFGWITPLLRYGYKHTIDIHDLDIVAPYCSAQRLLSQADYSFIYLKFHELQLDGYIRSVKQYLKQHKRHLRFMEHAQPIISAQSSLNLLTLTEEALIKPESVQNDANHRSGGGSDIGISSVQNGFDFSTHFQRLKPQDYLTLKDSTTMFNFHQANGDAAQANKENPDGPQRSVDQPKIEYGYDMPAHFGSNIQHIPGRYTTMYTRASLYRMFWDVTGRRTIYAFILKFFSVTCSFFPAMILNLLLHFVRDPDTAPFMGGKRGFFGYLCAILLVAFNWGEKIFMQNAYHLFIREGARARSLTMGLVYRKLLTMSSPIRNGIGNGLLNNIISTDANRTDNVYWMGDYAIFAPLQCTITIALLLYYIGTAALVGVAVLVLMIPIQLLIARVGTNLTSHNQQATDRRIDATMELLTGIKTLKMHNWEFTFLELVSRLRSAECRALALRQLWNGVQNMVLQSAPAFVATGTFYTYVYLQGKELIPRLAFTALPLFNLLQTTLWALPWTVQYIIEFHVALGRLSAFLSLPDKENALYTFEYRRICVPKLFTASINTDASVETPATINSQYHNDTFHILDSKDISLPTTYSTPNHLIFFNINNNNDNDNNQGQINTSPPPLPSSPSTLSSSFDLLNSGSLHDPLNDSEPVILGEDYLHIVQTQTNNIPIGEIRIINTDFWTSTYTSPNTTKAVITSPMFPPGESIAFPLPTFHVPKLIIPRGSLTCIVGPIGAGKSFLLACILGDVPSAPSIYPHIPDLINTVVYSNDVIEKAAILQTLKQQTFVQPISKRSFCHPQNTICYVPQQAWIIAGTVRDNIILDAPYIPQLFLESIQACALDRDIAQMPDGDLTVIAERGSTLSGGQRQRISICRAVYHRHLTSVFIFDSPLSALDSNVSSHIYQHVLGPHGLLRDKTRILVTHQLQWAKDADQIISMQSTSASQQVSEIIQHGLDGNSNSNPNPHSNIVSAETSLGSSFVDKKHLNSTITIHPGSLMFRIVECGTFQELIKEGQGQGQGQSGDEEPEQPQTLQSAPSAFFCPQFTPSPVQREVAETKLTTVQTSISAINQCQNTLLQVAMKLFTPLQSTLTSPQPITDLRVDLDQHGDGYDDNDQGETIKDQVQGSTAVLSFSSMYQQYIAVQQHDFSPQEDHEEPFERSSSSEAMHASSSFVEESRRGDSYVEMDGSTSLLDIPGKTSASHPAKASEGQCFSESLLLSQSFAVKGQRVGTHRIFDDIQQDGQNQEETTNSEENLFTKSPNSSIGAHQSVQVDSNPNSLSKNNSSLTSNSSFNLANNTSNISQPSQQSKQSRHDQFAKSKPYEPAKLTTTETRAIGEISWGTYFYYLTTMNVFLATLAILLCLGQVVVARMSDIWFSRWASDYYHRDAVFYLKIYVLLQGSTIVINLIANLLCALAGVRASVYLHSSMLTSIMYSPLSFFDTTPLGRISNRLSSDISSIDSSLPVAFFTWINLYIQIGSLLLVIVMQIWYFVFFFIPIGVIFIYISSYFRRSCRELRRLEATTRSPIFIHLDQTVDGVESIHCYSQHLSYLGQFLSLLDEHWRPRYLGQALNRWLAVRLDILGNIVLLAIILFFITFNIGDEGQPHPNDSALLGLLVSFALTLTGKLNWLVRGSIDTENQMNAVERCNEYSHLEPEWIGDPYSVLDKTYLNYTREAGKTHLMANKLVSKAHNAVQSNETSKMAPFFPPQTFSRSRSLITSAATSPIWPTHGAIQFRNVRARYRPGLPLVVKGITTNYQTQIVAHAPASLGPFNVDTAGKRIAIVGRTGAGKSSQIQLLLRLINTNTAIDFHTYCQSLLKDKQSKSGLLTESLLDNDYLKANHAASQPNPKPSGIEIDGIDIATLPLSFLRQNLCVVPQEPIVFTQSIRFNLSPQSVTSFSSSSPPIAGAKSPFELGYTIDELIGNADVEGQKPPIPVADISLWRCLHHVQLVQTVASLPDGLEYSLKSVTDLFSLGQRQLLCLARMMLKLFNYSPTKYSSVQQLRSNCLLFALPDAIASIASAPSSLSPPESRTPSSTTTTLNLSRSSSKRQQPAGPSSLNIVTCPGTNLSTPRLDCKKLLLLDEAASSVDNITETMMNSIIRNIVQTTRCTVISIAHHLHAIVDYDLVVVMEFGEIVEIGHPRTLLSAQTNPGKFYHLYHSE